MGATTNTETTSSRAGARRIAPGPRRRRQKPLLGRLVTSRKLASMCVGPQAYAYASGNPLKYSDPTGRYALDNSWDSQPAKKLMATKALQFIKQDSVCACAFKVGFGRLPFEDPFSVHYGISSFAPPAGAGKETYGFSPFFYLINNATDPALSQYLPALGTYQRIDVGDPSFVSEAELRDTMAHEMVHTSFNVRGESRSFPGPVSIGNMCSGKASRAFLPSEVQKCCKNDCGR